MYVCDDYLEIKFLDWKKDPLEVLRPCVTEWLN